MKRVLQTKKIIPRRIPKLNMVDIYNDLLKIRCNGVIYAIENFLRYNLKVEYTSKSSHLDPLTESDEEERIISWLDTHGVADGLTENLLRL